MKRTLIALAIVTGLVGCASTPTDTANTPIADQHMVTTFKRNNVKLEWSCAWGTGFSELTCIKGHITAIEATGYAPTYGSTATNRETAFVVAHDVALDKLSRFIKQDITSTRVVNTLTRNVEKAKDQLARNVKGGDVAENDDTAGTEDNATSNRTNVNETVRSVTENIKSNSTAILHGVQVVNEKVVDAKTVGVTIRWSLKNADDVHEIRKYFVR